MYDPTNHLDGCPSSGDDGPNHSSALNDDRAVDTKETRVSDQVFGDPEKDSIDADRDAAVDDTEDDDGFPPADRAGSVLVLQP